MSKKINFRFKTKLKLTGNFRVTVTSRADIYSEMARVCKVRPLPRQVTRPLRALIVVYDILNIDYSSGQDSFVLVDIFSELYQVHLPGTSILSPIIYSTWLRHRHPRQPPLQPSTILYQAPRRTLHRIPTLTWTLLTVRRRDRAPLRTFW